MKTLHAASLLALAVAALLPATSAIAAEPPDHAAGFAPLAPGERERLLDEAKSQRARAQALRSEAESEFRRSEAACYDKIMVSGCLGEARQERLRKTLEARRLDVAAERMQREVKLRDNAQREAQGSEKSPAREAAAAEEAARNSEAAQARAAENAKRDAERERELQAAPVRAAAEAADRRKSADDAAKREAAETKRAGKRAASAARQRAEIDRKSAEHARRRAEAQAAAAAKAAQTAAGNETAPKP